MLLISHSQPIFPDLRKPVLLRSTSTSTFLLAACPCFTFPFPRPTFPLHFSLIYQCSALNNTYSTPMLHLSFSRYSVFTPLFSSQHSTLPGLLSLLTFYSAIAHVSPYIFHLLHFHLTFTHAAPYLLLLLCIDCTFTTAYVPPHPLSKYVHIHTTSTTFPCNSTSILLYRHLSYCS